MWRASTSASRLIVSSMRAGLGGGATVMFSVRPITPPDVADHALDFTALVLVFDLPVQDDPAVLERTEYPATGVLNTEDRRSPNHPY
jgi:hypothetical protein